MGYKNYEQQQAVHASKAEKKKGSKGPSKHGSIKSDEKYDAKMAYNKNLSAKARMHYLENNIADHKGPSAYGKMHRGPSKMDPMYNGEPGVQKEDFQQFAGPSKHGEMHDSPMSMGGSFMSKHASNSYFHKKNLLDDMPIDDHAGGPLKQTAKDEQNVLDSRQKNINFHKKAEEDFYNKVKDYTPSSQEEVDIINKKLTDLNKNTNLRVNRYNKSLDSIKTVRKQKFEDLIK